MNFTQNSKEFLSNFQFIIVLGNSNSEVQKKRVSTAVNYFKSIYCHDDINFSNVMLIFSGGNNEGKNMCNYAVNFLGVDKEKCIIEDKSQNTCQNIEFTLNLLREGRWFDPTFATNYTFTICTSTFHIKRAFLISVMSLQKYGKVNCIHTNEPVSEEQRIKESKFIDEYLSHFVVSVGNAKNVQLET